MRRLFQNGNSGLKSAASKEIVMSETKEVVGGTKEVEGERTKTGGALEEGELTDADLQQVAGGAAEEPMVRKAGEKPL
jgi:hypothetical protein